MVGIFIGAIVGFTAANFLYQTGPGDYLVAIERTVFQVAAVAGVGLSVFIRSLIVS